MAFDQILKRNFWAVLLAMLAIAAFLNAQAITQLVGTSLAADDKQLAVPPLSAKGAASANDTAFHSTSAKAILSRNPFDSVTGALDRIPVVESDAGAVSSGLDLSHPWDAPACEGIKVLIIAESVDPEWSFVAGSPTSGDTKSVLRRRGGEIGNKTVYYIGWNRVWFTQGATLCQVELFKPFEPPKTVVAAAAAPPPAASGGAPTLDPAITKGIARVSATEFNIDRGVVDKILENQADLMRTARIVPEKEGDKMVGIRMYGVRADTLLGVLGMENGDRLQTINGFDMTSPEKALEAYARLRTADHLQVQVNRRGQNTNLDYNIK